MLERMHQAPVGDDVFMEDPSINTLEKFISEKFGMEAGLFCPSGTMTNQVAIKTHTQAGDEVICEELSHVYQYEGGGIAFNAGCSVKLLQGNRGRLTAEQIVAAINPEDVHKPISRLISLENTTNRGGGACYDISELKKIKEVCKEHNLKYHLDGARLWNAMVAKKQHPKQFGELFDTISVCLSKGLGAPVGSLLLGSKEDIKRALRIRKIFGGGMRQVGYLAAAGIYALDNNIDRLADDHRRAKELAAVLGQKDWVASVEPVETNILIFSLALQIKEADLIEKLKQKNILISSMGQGKLRIVTHLDYREVMHTYVLETLEKLVVC